MNNFQINHIIIWYDVYFPCRISTLLIKDISQDQYTTLTSHKSIMIDYIDDLHDSNGLYTDIFK